MYGLDMINTSVLGALGCDMNTFLRYFPAAETMYSLLVALAIGLILLGWVWNLFKNYGLGLGIEAEDPVRLTAKAILFIVLAYYADEIVNIALTIGGTPYAWILSSELPSLDFASFNSVLLTIIGVCANGGVALIVLILTLILAWNYIKLLFEAAERYVLLGVLVYTAPVAFAMGASQSTANIFKSWCRMFGGQIFLLLMNAWCLRLFTKPSRAGSSGGMRMCCAIRSGSPSVLERSPRRRQTGWAMKRLCAGQRGSTPFSLPPIQTASTSIITFTTIPPPWTIPGNSGIFSDRRQPCGGSLTGYAWSMICL